MIIIEIINAMIIFKQPAIEVFYTISMNTEYILIKYGITLNI